MPRFDEEQLPEAWRRFEPLSEELLEPKSEEEIQDLAKDDWVMVLVRLWDAVGKSVEAEPERLDVYRRELVEVPRGLLERAVSRVIRENQYNNVPTVGVIWNALRAELGHPYDIQDAIQNWVEREWCSVKRKS